MYSHHCKFIGLLAILVTIIRSPTAASLVNTKIDRILDLSTQLVKIVDRIHIEEDNAATYKYLIDPSHRDRLAYIDASIQGATLKIVDKQDGSYEIDLAGNKQRPLVVTTIYTKLLQPYPTEIKQAERQFVKYQGSQAALSAYLTKTATTKIKLPSSSRLESFTKASKMTTGTNKLTYGPFKDVQPNQAEPLAIHYENNSPFVAVTKLLRTVEVSPWTQSISIVNQVKVAHVGAKLKGPFSRIDYQRDHSNGISSVRNLVAELPRSAKDIYFRDGIGNISTSSVRYTQGITQVNVKPRFPLFGGWITDYYLGYRIPMNEFLNEPVSGSGFRLSLPISDVLYENMFIEEAEVHITLPAGASDIVVRDNDKGAIGFEHQQEEKSYSYLDVIGRPVVIVKERNVVTQHTDGKEVVVRFNYSKTYMAQEPILLMAAAIGTLILTALYSKLSSKVPSPNASKIKTN